jgi:beta-galactosidase
MIHFKKMLLIFVSLIIVFTQCSPSLQKTRKSENFNQGWKFNLGDVQDAQVSGFDDSNWRILNLPHDWSIEGVFSPEHPATPGGGALPGGIGWYRKSFQIPESEKGELAFIEFDGIYMKSTIWINEHELGTRPNGYISFRYELTPYLKYGQESNVIAVKVDNSLQPNSRWYSGSGIYRNVRLVMTDPVHVDQWGTYITTPEVNERFTAVSIQTRVRNDSDQDHAFTLKTTVYRPNGTKAATVVTDSVITKDSILNISQEATVRNPDLWSVHTPNLYRAVSRIECDGSVRDGCKTIFGIRTFSFDSEKGFFLNGKSTKILGVCNHHDLGCLGAAVNTRAIERQLEILKEMGCNAIRTSHNPPTPELLDLCDTMGFLVMDEFSDIWKKGKNPYDYSLYWDEWYEKDVRDFVLRDRNHPSVIIWSIGNEVMEQWDKQDSSGSIIAKELTAIVKKFDPTRPVTAACNDVSPLNPVIRSGALDLIGYNYAQDQYADFLKTYPGKRFIAAETVSALATRGSYDMPSDSIRRWPPRWDLPLLDGNPDHTCSSYDNCSAPWGSTHEETWKIIKKYDFLSGEYMWTGFDYLGEPTPYGWPARSSYFGIVDLAGFPKDAFYFYLSEWTDRPVLHIFPHWNWNEGDQIDVWAYTNCEEVELFLNGKSQGVQKKSEDKLHLVWRLSYVPGTLKAVGSISGKDILIKEIKTAAKPAKIALIPDRKTIHPDGRDLSFITVQILDADDVLCPLADNLVRFEVMGSGTLKAVDNGLQTSHESFQAKQRKAFHGLCLAVVQSAEKPGKILLKASSDGLKGNEITIHTK